MRPPPGWASFSKVVWKQLKPAYGLVESGRLWQLTVEKWLHEKDRLETVPGFPQLFLMRNELSTPKLIIAKIVDDFLLAGRKDELNSFHNNISQKFKVGRFLLDQKVIFNRLHISQDNEYNVTISMDEYMDKISPLVLTTNTKKQQDSKCNEDERKLFLGLTGQLNWLGHGSLPQASYISSKLQEYTGDLRIKHMCEANQLLRSISNLEPTIFYKSPQNPTSNLSNSSVLTFSDASQGKTTYGQTGYVTGIHFPDNLYHILDWHSSKQYRVSFSSMGAEIIAAAESAD